MKEEVAKLKLYEDIVFGEDKITLLDPKVYENELVKFADESVAFQYIDKRTSITIIKESLIIKDPKLVWQKAQQQQR